MRSIKTITKDSPNEILRSCFHINFFIKNLRPNKRISQKNFCKFTYMVDHMKIKDGNLHIEFYILKKVIRNVLRP